MNTSHLLAAIALSAASTLANAQQPQTPPADRAPSTPDTAARPGEATGDRLGRTDGVIKPPTEQFPSPQAEVPNPRPQTTPVIPQDPTQPRPK
jgi:hypothetical protein